MQTQLFKSKTEFDCAFPHVSNRPTAYPCVAILEVKEYDDVGFGFDTLLPVGFVYKSDFKAPKKGSVVDWKDVGNEKPTSDQRRAILNLSETLGYGLPDWGKVTRSNAQEMIGRLIRDAADRPLSRVGCIDDDFDEEMMEYWPQEF